jgi:hypothetical protein
MIPCHRLTVVTILILLGAANAAGQNSFIGRKPPEVTAPQWVNADHHPTLASLKGQPVLLVFWGLKCEVCQCRDVLRKCAALYRKQSRKGLEILGLHMHKVSHAGLDLFSMRFGIDFPMGNGGYYTDYGLDQVPYLYLVDGEGLVVWQGRDLGGEFSKKLGIALRRVDRMGEETWPKSMKSLKKLVSQRAFGKLIDKLVDFTADIEHAEEDRKVAQAFKTRLQKTAEGEYLRATSYIRRGDPSKGMAILETMAAEYKGHPFGRKAMIRLKELRKNPEQKAALRAAELYRSFRGFLKGGNMRGANAKARMLLKLFPKSLYAQKTKALLEAFYEVD